LGTRGKGEKPKVRKTKKERSVTGVAKKGGITISAINVVCTLEKDMPSKVKRWANGRSEF